MIRRRRARGWARRAAGNPGRPPRLAVGQRRPGLVSELSKGIVDAQRKHVSNSQAVDADREAGVVEPGPVAGWARDGDIREVLDVEVNVGEAAARRALALPGIEREMPGFPAPPTGVRGFGKNAADLVERSRVSGGRRPRVLADRGGVDLDDLTNPVKL